MIMRIWHGVTLAEKADAYLEYLQATGVKEYRAIPGNLSVQVVRRISEGRAEFLTITLWDSWEAIRRFAGADVDTPVYYPEEDAYLLEREAKVVHYELLVQEESHV
jgi:heme-degrading monooxygenase HmoA